jgi:hypothetical protein
VQNKKACFYDVMKINYFLIWIFIAKAFNGIPINTYVNSNLFVATASKHKINIL